MPWFVAALIAMVTFSGLTLAVKRLTLLAVPPAVISQTALLGTAVGFFGVVLAEGRSLHVPAAARLPIAGLGLAIVAFNLSTIGALQRAPNPGFVEAISALRVVIVALAAVPLFGASLEPIHLLGMALAVAGLVLVAT